MTAFNSKLKELKECAEKTLDAEKSKTWLMLYTDNLMYRVACEPAMVLELLKRYTIMREALEVIARRPDLPNPERDADWKNCMKFSSHEAREALAIVEGDE